MIAYIDSSVILRWLLREPNPVSKVDQFDSFYSSAMLRIECKRALHRLLLISEINEETFITLSKELMLYISGVLLVDIGKQIQRRAEESFVFPIGSLDAIHLSTALAIRGDDEVVFLTHDLQLGKNARALEFEVVGV